MCTLPGTVQSIFYLHFTSITIVGNPTEQDELHIGMHEDENLQDFRSFNCPLAVPLNGVVQIQGTQNTNVFNDP
jgi:hypothetical protein